MSELKAVDEMAEGLAGLEEDVLSTGTGEQPVTWFQDNPIYPLTRGRQVTAQRLNCWVFNEQNVQAMKEEEDGSVSLQYPGLYEDIVLILFICSRKKEEQIQLRRDPDKTRVEAEEWADSLEGINFAGESWGEFNEAFATATAGCLGKRQSE